MKDEKERPGPCQKRRWCWVLSRHSPLALVTLLIVGCGSQGPYPVSGKLEYDDGQPLKELAGFEVTFTSEAVKKSARGVIQPDGTFRLTTNRKDDGAFPGGYKVIVAQAHPEPDRPFVGNPVVDVKYEDPDKTPLEATVEAKTNNLPPFRLERIRRKR